MRPLRFLRGAIITALVWATSWAVVGALLNTAIVMVSSGGLAWLSEPRALARVTLSAASAFGMAGALIGCVFAVVLAVAGRKISFRELTGRRVFILGGLGGLAVAGALFTLRVLLIGYPARGFFQDFALAGALSAATAWLTLRIARRAPPDRTVSELAAGTDWGAEATRATRESQPAVPT